MKNLSKIEALKSLVNAAVLETREGSNFDLSDFEGTFDTPAMDKLIDTLRTSDALYVLNEALNTKGENG